MSKDKKKEKKGPTYRKVIKDALELMDHDYFRFEKVSRTCYRIIAFDQDAISEAEVYAEDLGDRLGIRTNIFNARSCMDELGMSREEVYRTAYSTWKEYGGGHAFVFDDDEEAMMHMFCDLTCGPEDISPVMLACLLTDMFEESSAITARLFGAVMFRPDEPEPEEE